MPITKFGLIFASTALWLSLAANVAAQQNLTINGAPCTFTSYTKTVTQAGAPSFAFTAPGCTTGGAPTPAAGTMQFTAPTYASVDAGSPRDVIVQRNGFVAGGNNPISGTVASTTPSTCTVANGAVSFPDGDTGNKAVAVTAAAAGTCNVTLTTANQGSQLTASLTVTNANADGEIGFATSSQSAVAGSTGTLTINIARTLAGSNSGPASVAFTCTPTNLGASLSLTNSPLSFPNNGNATIPISIFGVPAFAVGQTSGTIVCTLNSPTDATLASGQTTHTINVTSQPVPTCVPTATTNPVSLVAGTGGTANFTANCTNGATMFTWTAITAGAPALTNGTTATPSATVGSGVAAGTYQYSVVGANGGGNSSAANASFTVGTASTSNCVIKDRMSDYPGWNPGNAYNTSGSPMINQPRGETYAYRFRLSEVFNPAVATARGDFQMDEPLQGIYHTISITAQPCVFTETISTSTAQCQTSGNTGRMGYTFVRSNDPRANSFLNSFGICRLPDLGAQDFLYANVRFAGPTGVEPQTITCPNASCSYFPLYQKID